MDVRCSRCGTEYEFDDALISERGTTVKCTNCGFQFKIFPDQAQGRAPERWLVRTGAGRELVYTSLRELQRAIAEQTVTASDLLSRGDQAPRPLGSIAELEPFFQVTSVKPSEFGQRTLHGVAPPGNAHGPSGGFDSGVAEPISDTTRIPTLAGPPLVDPAGYGYSPAPPSEPLQPSVAPVEAEPRRPAVLRETLRESEPGLRTAANSGRDLTRTLPAGSSPSALGFDTGQAPPSSRRRGMNERASDSSQGSLLAGTPMSPRVAAWEHSHEVPISSRAPVSSPRNLPPIEVESIRDSFKSYDELHLDGQADDHHARVARSRWIAGVVVIGVLGLLGATVGRRYLSQLTGAGEVNATSDARVAKFLSDGARLVDEGDFEGAKEEFDKATALAEKDPAVLTALARLETLRADIYWLKLRLIDPNSTDLVQATYRELGSRVGKARTAVDRAFAVSPEDPAVLRARVDSLRLSGDGDKAREWLAPLSANASVPENAYVLAALDLAEPAPVWPTVIDRLRTAAAAERDPGRARAALIYALAQANRVPEAEAEFANIDGRQKPHPLLEELRAFLQRAKHSVETAGSAAAKIPAVDTTKLPKLDTSPATGDDDLRAANGDFRARLARAAAALRDGELSRAEQLYSSVLQEQPKNSEATTGLGDVARARHDSAQASRMYDRALAENPSYLPALSASADQKWDSGDRAGAVALYRRLLEEAGPSSAYAVRAASRIAQTTAPSGSAAPVGSGSSATPGPPNTPTAPEIDTTDLPGAK